MNIFLSSVRIAIFFRSTIDNEDAFFENIIKKYSPLFKNIIKNKFPYFPGMPNEIPIITAVTNDGIYGIQLSKMRLDIFLSKNISALEYNNSLNLFLEINKNALSSIDFDINLCTRVGVVETSFYPCDNPVRFIVKRFIKNITATKDIKINTTNSDKIEINNKIIEINKTLAIEAGTLNLINSSSQYGIIQRKDINTLPYPKLELKIINKILDYVQKEMGKEKALEMLNVKA